MTVRGNPDYLETFIGEMGETALWIGFAFLVTATVVSTFLAYIRNVKPEGRFFYYLVAAINAIGALSYLIQALGNANMTITENVPGVDNARDFQWLRYAQFALTGPLTIITFGLLAGAQWVDIFFVSIATLLGVGAGFAGALSSGDNATWPLLGFAAATFLVVIVALVYSFRKSAYNVHVEIGKLYDVLAFSSALLYTGYIVFWGTSEGGHQTSADQELIVYTVFDILAKAVWGIFLLVARESIARYGSFLGLLNTSVEYDFPIPKSVTHA